MQIVKALLPVFCMASAVCAAAGPPVRVVLARVADHRAYAAPGVTQPMFPGESPGLRVTLQVQGEPAAVATSLGVVRVAATDNLGGVLKEKFANVGGGPIYPRDKGMHRIHFDSAGRAHRPRWFDVVLRLSEPPRAATAIVNLRGSFRVVGGGKLEDVTLDPLQTRGKEVNSAVLKKAGLKIWVLKSAIHGAYVPGPAKKYLILYITGHELDLKKVEAQNASGRSMLTGLFFDSSSHNTLITAYQLRRPFAAGDRVKLRVALGQKIVRIPFDFATVALP